MGHLLTIWKIKVWVWKEEKEEMTEAKQKGLPTIIGRH